MSSFSEEYQELSANESALFSEVVNRLFSDGFIWYEDKAKVAPYTFLRRHFEIVKEYLNMSGWMLTWHEQQRISSTTQKRLDPPWSTCQLDGFVPTPLPNTEKYQCPGRFAFRLFNKRTASSTNAVLLLLRRS